MQVPLGCEVVAAQRMGTYRNEPGTRSQVVSCWRIYYFESDPYSVRSVTGVSARERPAHSSRQGDRKAV